MAKMKEYQVQASLNVLVAIGVNAVSLEEAMEKSKRLTEDCFIEILGENMAVDFRITGVYESDP